MLQEGHVKNCFFLAKGLDYSSKRTRDEGVILGFTKRPFFETKILALKPTLNGSFLLLAEFHRKSAFPGLGNYQINTGGQLVHKNLRIS